MDKQKQKVLKRQRKHKRIRTKIKGTAEIPRLSVFRSNKSMFLQLIDDMAEKTLVSVSPKEVKGKGTKTDLGYYMGEKLAEKAKKKNIEKVVFDRGGYTFHGRIKAVADAAREKGVIF